MKRPMLFFRRRAAAVASLLSTLVLTALSAPTAALAADAPAGGVVGMPRPWEIGMQPAYSPVKDAIIHLHDLVMIIITIISVFVAALLVWVAYRYNAKRNPVPSRLSHHTWLEIAWTVIPALILAAIAIPSFRLVYYEDRTQDPALTIKVTAHQWYWEYGYPDQGISDLEARVVDDADLKPGQPRLLTVDNEIEVPVGKNVRVLETSADVIHSWFIPALGVQRYAIPGRTIETWFKAEKPGVFYGECNQICGAFHSHMPIVVRAVSDDDFKAWVTKTKAALSSSQNVPAGQNTFAEIQR